MAQSVNSKKTTVNGNAKGSTASNSTQAKSGNKSAPKAAQPRRTQRRQQITNAVPSWLGALVSVVGVGVAVGAGLYATRRQWLPKANEWKNDFSAAFADDETDYENFDQTRHAGRDSMRDHPGDDWSDVDDMSDASFPASDPPSFTPGTAS
jgi:hypothetical protein